MSQTGGLGRLWHQGLRFILVGLAATAAHLGVMAGLIAVGAVGALAATFIGSLVGSVITYLANRSLTFKSSTPHRLALVRHYVTVAGSIALNAVLFHIAHESLVLAVWLAQVLASGLCMVFNFIVSRFWVFRSS